MRDRGQGWAIHPVARTAACLCRGSADTALHIAGAIADALVPPVCLGCRTPLAAHGVLCPACWSDVAFIRPPVCDRLGIPLPYAPGDGPLLSAAAMAEPPAYDRARAVAIFEGVMRRLVHALKYADRQDGRRLFGRWLAEAARDLVADADMIVPVPLARWRLWQRRFNQSALLAAALARETGLTMEPLALRRIRATRSQVGLTKAQRRQNVAGAFRIAPKRRRRIEGRAVLLVDDVITTGATVEACAKALRRAGARRVDVAALARVTDLTRSPF